MKIQKTELAAKLNQIKGVVPKKTTMPILQGILVKEGYLIANNLEMTVKAKLEGTEDECFIIPERAFDLINNLPDGEIDITISGGNTMTIKADKIKISIRQWIQDHSRYQILRAREVSLRLKQDFCWNL